MTQTSPTLLRRDAEKITGALPPLLANAEKLANSVMLGVHGRKRAGTGEDFWQYRQAMPGDDIANIDWRRSGRSDAVYIRQNEWEAAHTVALWCDGARSMAYSSHKSVPTKAARAQMLTMALAILLSKAGERISLLGTNAAESKTGEQHLQRIAWALAGDENDADFGAAPNFHDLKAARSVFISDFLGENENILAPMQAAAERAGTGCIVQILDPAEEEFPFDGRVIFESMGGAIKFETHRANGLRESYQTRLAERTELLETFARQSGWRFIRHRTSDSATNLLLWLYMSIGEQV